GRPAPGVETAARARVFGDGTESLRERTRRVHRSRHALRNAACRFPETSHPLRLNVSSAYQRVDRPALERSSGRLALILAAILCALAPHVYAAAATEYEVKAAFIYHFTKFVTWPE